MTMTTNRNTVRVTAGRVFRSDDLVGDEKAVAIAILRENPGLGNPHVIRCPWCKETRTLFRDENDAPFEIAGRGWRCVPCEMAAASQEVKM